MAAKRKRNKSVGSGVRKNRAGKNCARKGPAVADPGQASFLKTQRQGIWPTESTMVKAHELLTEKKPRQASSPKKPMNQGFTVLDYLIDKPYIEKLLVAASLKLKRVRRYPGYVLQRTYNLKSRPIEII